MKASTHLSLVLAFVLGFASSGAAQETRGSIEGVVKDTSGAVLPGATVEARSPALVGVAVATSDSAGVYRFPALAPGLYQVSATLTGFQPSKVENIRLDLGQILKVDFSMQIGGLTESVQVSAESPLIDVKQNVSAASITADLIERIPKGRDFPSLLNSAPGTQNEGRGGGVMIDGASGSENRFIVDGMDTTSLQTGVSNKEVLTDFLAEVQVKSSGYNAEFRAATGGVITAITKSGSNSFRGELGAHYEPNDWYGDVRGSLRLNPTNQNVAEYTRTPRDDEYTVEPVVSLGGPVVRDRLWFFAGYIPQITEQRRTVTFTQGGETRTFENPRRDHNLNWNTTGQITNDLRFRINGINETEQGGVTLPGKEPNGTSLSNPTLFPNPLRTDRFNDLYSGVMDWVVNPSMYVNVTAGWLKYGSESAGAEFNTGIRRTFSGSNTCTQSSCPFPEIPANLQQVNGYADAPSNSFTVKDDFTRFNISADTTFFTHWKGQHSIKAGILYERYGNNVNTGQQAPNVSITWNGTRASLDGRDVRGRYGYYEIRQSFTAGNISSENVGLYIQDSWTMNNRLTVNYGIRTESEEIPSYRPENPGFKFGWGDKLAPRLGFAYDVQGNSKWKVYGSWGMFYDIFKLELPRGSFGADRWISYYWTLDTFNWPSINCDGTPGSGCPGTYIEQVDFRHVSNEPGQVLVEPDLKPFRAQEASIGLDHELTRTMSIGARYTHKWLDRTIEDAGIQVPGVGEVFYIVNVGEGIGKQILGPQYPAQPKPVRDYDGLELRLRKRLANRWSMNSSLLFSRLYGNYSGLASSDENGRNSPNVNRLFDGLHMSFNETGKPDYGLLQTDRPVVFELQGTYELPWGTGVGVEYFAGSGTPLQSQATIQGVPVLYKGRGNLGRTPALTYTDLAVWHDFRIRGNTRLQLSVNFDNIFDQDTATSFDTTPYRDSVPTSLVTNDVFFSGFDTEALVATRPSVRKDAQFLQPNAFLGAREVRVMAKIRF